jgi:heme-degrading monooxygenase HmoA
MILRVWRGRADLERGDAYVEHFRRHVVAELRAVSGFLGADLVRREVDGGLEFTVCTRWVSMDAVRCFAGAEPDRAVVDPGAVAALRSYDDHVTHHVVVEHVEPAGGRA